MQGRTNDLFIDARRVEGRQRGWGSWGGAATLYPPARGMGERCEGSGGALTAQRFSTIFSTQDGLS